MGRLSWRVWLLGVFVIFSIILILSGDSYLRLLIFILLLAGLVGINSVKSKTKLFILVIAVLVVSVFLAYNSFDTGVSVKSVEQNSSVYESGLRAGEIIQAINGIEINTKEDYSKAIGEIFANEGQKRIDIQTKENEYTFLAKESPQITIDEVAKTNIQTGLDLRGGARALVKPDVEITADQLDDLVSVSRNRFNVYGLSDVQITGVRDLEGNKFMLVEVAGASPADLEQLVSQQGKFEAKVGNETVFIGGERDVSDVCRNDATCAGITNCQEQEGQSYCNFAFTIYLTEAAAKRHADITKGIGLDETGQYLTERLYLYVDDQEVDSLLISSGLRGQVTTQIQIQGGEVGETQEEAMKIARAEMNRLQTILLTGSLPYKLEIEKLDTISPTLGDEFTRSILLAGISSILLVSLIVFVRYRKFKQSIAMLLTAFSEIIIILGVASLIRWNLDLPSIAGILATIGTGIDQQIVIMDEAGRSKEISIKEKMKRALFVIGTAYATTVVSLLPLGWAGAGLFKGFAITTIIGITAGVLITRPAFADIIKKIEG